MKQFLRNILLLGIPFGLYLIAVLLVDPYNNYAFPSIVDDSHKSRISQNVQQHLFRMIRFENAPRRNISLGDSRANSLDHVLDHERWGNLSFGGASLKETFEAFWWCAESFELDTVLMAVNFNNYNKFNKRFWVEETLKIKKNFFSYTFNRYTFRAGFLVSKSALTKREMNVNQTTLNKEEFWVSQISMLPEKFFGKYAYPENYYRDLQEIADHCSNKGIKLIIWIPPTAMDFQLALEKFKLSKEEEMFRSDMRSIAEVYDYNYPNAITENEECFRDPLHVTNSTAIRIRDEILANRPVIARHYRP